LRNSQAAVAGIAAREADGKKGVARKWRRNGLKRLNPRPEMVWARKPRTYNIWYAAALTVRDYGLRATRTTKLQKKAPNALKSFDAKLKWAPAPEEASGNPEPRHVRPSLDAVRFRGMTLTFPSHPLMLND
jgi:hypothetical protein